jgi:hypothetical protein
VINFCGSFWMTALTQLDHLVPCNILVGSLCMRPGYGQHVFSVNNTYSIYRIPNPIK